MRTIFRWLLRLTTSLLVLVLIGGGLVYFLASRSLPDYNKQVDVIGVSAPLEIVRDNANVPHIFGESDADVFFGLGYTHAQDRLWQMTILRRTVQGRLSEVFGPDTLRIDVMMRTLALYQFADDSFAFQDDYTKTALQAYSAGVNARLDEINRDHLGRGAPEFFLFDAPISRWRPSDSMAIISLMGVRLSSHLNTEVMRARVSLALDDRERLNDLLPDTPGAAIAALPKYSELFPTVSKGTVSSKYAEHTLSPFSSYGFAGASNAFAASPNRSSNGGTLLANDPHLAFSSPAIWYLARLALADGHIIGGTLPGVPVVMTGRSDNLAWGLTSSFMDDQDLYIERLNPENPNEYLTPSGYRPFETRQSIVEVKNADPVTVTLRWTENGPVLPLHEFALDTITPTGHVPSLAWTLLSAENTTMTAAMRLMRATSIEDAIRHTELFVAPSQIITLADQETVAMRLMGEIPRRNRLHDTQGRLPSRGWILENRWDGRLPVFDNPQFINPDGGILGNTNNKIVDRPFPSHVSFDWGDTQRIKRWQKLMQSRDVHTRDSFIEAQLDTVSYAARSLLPLVGADLWFTGEAANEGTPERLRRQALALLAEWNGEMNEHIPEPLLYASWLRALQDRLIRDELGALADEFSHVGPIFIERVFRDINGASIWCDIVQSREQESCSQIAKLALDDALVSITEQYGSNLGALRWGDAHEALHNHPVLGDVPLLGFLVNIRQSTSGGDHTLQRGRTSGVEPNPFQNVHGAGYRGIYVLADPDSSVFIISTGQSGHLLSRHYDDLAQLWRRGEYLPMSLDENLARAAAIGTTVLLPANR
ncbi:MAG: penicillin acylase family protein [Aestuariivita sp.]|nr:penicillin acylase family protein [Aestuariivita sp.]MCY4201069.1 penicillin acylase family protein [Aestuariivita sp.]MCY4288865.1 penicillin acylase family protein [Aestuariivita sp.]MCY4345219.1 penicillin acylase family protein [Aestuariivita sp.]